MNADVLYWDRGIDAVPVMTGAATVLDASEIAAVCGRLWLEFPLPNVLDVGCGTGRFAKLCNGYVGVDIAPSAVAYCQREGLTASTISGPDDLPAGPFGLIACLSVFTHINRDARRAYLRAFAERADRVLVDVIHGTEGGDVTMWRADLAGFRADIAEAGFRVHASTQGVGIGALHTYYSVRKPA
jgi:SAM-dependent methyltransferase